jgi:hypothetical protein
MPNGFWLLRAGNGQQQSAINVNGICSQFQWLIDGGGIRKAPDRRAPQAATTRPRPVHISAELGRSA